MAYLLATTWLLVEAFLIPEGLLKWFYLGFYIHPLILVLCQILHWVKLLVSWTRHVLAVSFGFISFVGTSVVTVSAGGVVNEPENEAFVDACGNVSSEQRPEASSGSKDLNMLRVMVIVLSNVAEEEPGVAVTSTLIGMDDHGNDDAASVCSSQLTLSLEEVADGKSIERDPFCESGAPTMEGLDDPALACGSRLTPMPSEAGDNEATRIGQDPFYLNYTQTMAWFDLLNHERTCGISAVLQAQCKETVRRISSISVDSAKKRLIRSLESDLELVYVAQTCLSWEILCYQQKKVEHLLTNSTRQASIRFDHTVAEELQKFRVLVQRFTEDERFINRCRYREYVRARASCKSLLQVPEIPGGRQVEDGVEEEEEEAAVELDEVRKAMEKCIRAFHGFVKADNKHKGEINSCSWWRLSLLLKSSLFLSWSSRPPVEDPRDLPLFSDLKSILLQKSLRLRDLKGKKKWGLRTMKNKKNKNDSTRASPSGDHPQREKETTSSSLLLFTEIDLELVARVLQMSTISSAHLTWCQAKLDNVCFGQGKLSRVNIFPLFPY